MVKGDRGFEAAEIRALLDGAGAQLKAMILLGITRINAAVHCAPCKKRIQLETVAFWDEFAGSTIGGCQISHRKSSQFVDATIAPECFGRPLHTAGRTGSRKQGDAVPE